MIPFFLLVLVSFLGGWLIASYKYSSFKIEQLAAREKILIELSTAKHQIETSKQWYTEYKLLNDELHNLRNINASLEANLREITIKFESTKLHAEDKIHQMMSNEQRLNKQFENLANRIFIENNRQIDEQNRQSLSNLLMPLREQLDNFRHQILDNFSQEVRERHALVHEIRILQQLNTQMAQEAVNLTHALKGNNKIQGNWGSLILTRVLETSGLRKGFEYEIQVNVETDTNTRMQPDVIVHLPQGKDIIIDAKMALVAYERYFNTQDETVKKLALQDHIISIRNHIKLLSRKNYQQLPGLRLLDYVLMFIPIEPAFLLAIDNKPELITEALNNNIMLVSPTTLLVALRTISNLWVHEHQNQNVQMISDYASKLYDTMRLFVDDISLIGKNLNRVQNSYCQAMKKLTSGRNSLLTQAETFRSLGVKVKCKINSELVERAISQNEEHCSVDIINESGFSHKETVSTNSMC